MKIVFFTPKFLNGFKTLYKSIWKDEPYGELFTEEEVEQVIAKQEVFYVGLDANGSVIGFIAGFDFTSYSRPDEVPSYITEGKVFYFSELAVAPEYRKHGYAQQLYKELEEHLLNDNYQTVILRTSSSATNPAINFYNKQNFVQIEGITSQIEQNRIDDRPAVDNRMYLFKTITKANSTLQPKYNYDNIISNFKRQNKIDVILGISGGANSDILGLENDESLRIKVQTFKEEYQKHLITDFLSLLKDYRVAILTGGTKGGIPEIATRLAKELGFKTIGVYPAVGQRHRLGDALIDLSLCVHPLIGCSNWGDEGPVWTNIVDGVMVIGGGSGTLIECAHLFKINESRFKKQEPLKIIAPISNSGGTSEQVNYLCTNPELKYKTLPSYPINKGSEAAKFLLHQLSLSDYFDYLIN